MGAVDLVSFDVYGTLVRFHEAVRGALAEGLAERGAPPGTLDRFHPHFRATQAPLQRGGWRPYREVLALGLEQALTDFGFAYAPRDGERLVEAVASAGPFAEVPAVLREIGSRAKLMFISNTDDAMIARNVAAIGVEPDVLVSAEQSRLYKPDLGMFRFAYDRAGVPVGRAVHVAAGFFHDIEPAHALGIRRIWINRRGEAGDPAFGPYAEMPDMSRLVEAIWPG
ncbi:MAG: HAD family hydrolase [Alphaproteobacteria bacterium]